MIEEWLNVLLFLSGCIKPSAISGIYMLIALFILTMLLTIYQVPKFMYKCLFFISLLLVTWKSIMLTLLYEGYISEVFEKERYLLHLLGIFYNKDLTWDESSSFTFIPDTLAFVCSIVGWIYAKKVKFKPSDNKRKNLWLFCSFLALTGTCASSFSYINIAYFLLWIYWAGCWALKMSKSVFKYGIIVISLMTTLQILFSYFYFILLTENITESQAELYGIILNKPKFLPNYILVFVLHCFATMYVRKAGIKEDRMLHQKLIENQEFLNKDKSSINEVLKTEDIEESRKHLMKKVQETDFDELSGDDYSSGSLYTDSDASQKEGKSSEESSSEGSSSEDSDKVEKKQEKSLEVKKEKEEHKIEEEAKLDKDENFIANQVLKNEGNEGLTSVVSLLKCSFFLKLLLSPTLLFFIARFLLFFWIFYFKSAIGVYIMIWLFYSIIELDYDRMIISSRVALIPILILNAFITYIFKTISFELPQICGLYYKYLPAVELLFQLLTILAFIFINRVLGYNTKISFIETETKSIWGIFYTIIQQNSDKFALIVLFLVGLSDINLFHIGFIFICILFLFNIQLARKLWKLLMFYTMTILITRYIWVLISHYFTLGSEEILKMIGLPTLSSTNQEIWEVIPHDYTIWILLLSTSIQNRAFGSTMFSLDYYKLTKKDFRRQHPLLVKYIVNVYEWYTIFQVWVSYFFIFLLMLMANLNILNYVRFACFCVFMLIHLQNVMVEISVNYCRVKRLWGVTVYYSGAVLIIRYIYQFLPFFKLGIELQYPLIGLEVYKDNQLYRNMVIDCMLLLFSILESRNRQHILERESFNFEEVGFLSGIIRSNLSLIGQEKHVIAALQFLEEPFPLIVLFAVSTLSIYWRLSLSMICYLVASGWYLLRLGNFFGEVVDHKQLYSAEVEWERRVSVWNVMFLFTFANFLFAYAEFLVTPQIFGEELYQKVLWMYFCCGFSKSEGRSLLKISYGYVILWILLIIERHCIEFMLNTRVNISQEDEFRRLKNKNLTLMKTLDFLRIFAEALVPMFVLMIAFSKLTFISIIYVLAVFLCIIFASPYRRTHYLNTIVICMIWLQYLLILSNIQTKNSPEHPPRDKKVTNTPWYTRIDWITPDDPVFLNLGTSIDQLHSTYLDLLCSLFIMIYYKFLCTKEHELFLLEYSNTGPEQPSKSKTIFSLVKKTVYNISHLIIFLFVLLFIIQNNGIISGVYCAFCLIFIYGANQNIRSERRWNTYLRILRIYFLNFMLLDLTLNILIQIPFGIVNISNDGWLVAIGVERLWRAGQDTSPPNESELHTKVTFKIIAFAFLYMMYRMMRSKDFNKHMESERIHLKKQGKVYGLALAREFNNKRIEENAMYLEKRARFETELKKLDVNVQKWNQKFYEEKRDSLPGRNRAITVARKSVKPLEESQTEPTFRSKLQNLLIRLINPVIFRGYLDSLNSKKKVIKEVQDVQDLEEQQSEEFQEVEFTEKKTLAEYNLNWKNYVMLFLLILMSNTQGLVYLFCIINHLVYASLESVVFPLTVIGYAIMEYPRPPFKYFRFIMLYSELVFFIKFTLQFQIWEFVFKSEFLKNYKDQYKIGFNIASNTYSQTLVNYVIWDVIVMLFVLLHEYFLLRVGLWSSTEYEMESLEEAKKRINGESFGVRVSENQESRRSGFITRASRQVKMFFNRLLPHNKEEKPGKDLYTPTLLVQLIILLYLFLFFSQMDGKGMNISESFKANQFQGRMVIAIMFHIGIMIIERYLYLARTSQALKLAVARLSHTNNKEPNIKWDRPLQIKLGVHIVLLLNMCFIVFWYFPMNSNNLTIGEPYCTELYDEKKCNNFQINLALKFYYLIYTVYLIVVSLQLKYGLPSFRSGSFPLMKSTSKASKLLFQFYRGIPFLFEIRTLVDWVFTLTTLDLFQWLKFENLYAQLYINQCNSRFYQARLRGSAIGTGSKMSMGCCSLLIIFGIILAPLILFSSLNPIVEYNRVKTMSVQIGIIINDNYFNLYSASRVSDIHTITESEWEKNKFNSLNGVDSNDKENFQVISMPTTSDSLWDITPHSFNQLCNYFDIIIKFRSDDIVLHMSHTYTRKYPLAVPRLTEDFSYHLTRNQIIDLNQTVCSTKTIDFNYPDLPLIVVWLPSSGENMSPDVITDNEHKDTIVLKKLEDEHGYYYWEVGMNKTENGLSGLNFFAISEKYSPMTFSFSVVTFYISVVGLAGRLLRWVLAGPVNFIMTEMPNPEPLINMCNGVYLSRMTGDLLREEELYYELVDIIRSPEMLKSITGRSSIKEKIE